MEYPYKAKVSLTHCSIYEKVQGVWEYSKTFLTFEEACEYYKAWRNVNLVKICQIVDVTE